MANLTLVLPCVDKDGQAENCSHNALYVRRVLNIRSPIAIPLDLDNMTLFHITFVYLFDVIPSNVHFENGAKSGIQINIDRVSSYSVPLGKPLSIPYIQEKWNVPLSDAKALQLFFSTVLTGEDHYKVYAKDVMHKLVRGKSSKQEFEAEINAPDNDESPF